MNENEKKSSNYEFKSEAVDQLLDAQNGNVQEFTQEELDKYRKKKFSMPMWLKVVLIKAWFAGAVCFFIVWGLGMYLGDPLDMMFVTGAVLGMVMDLLTNNVIRFIEVTPGDNDRWLLCQKRGMVGFGLNLLFGYLIYFCVYNTYGLINYLINYIAVSTTGDTSTLFLGVGPLLFGLLCMGYEMLLIGMKRMVKSIIRDAKAAVDDQAST